MERSGVKNLFKDKNSILLRRNDKIVLIVNEKEDKAVGTKLPSLSFHLPTKKKLYEKNMAKR